MRDVACDLRRADDFTVGIEDRRDRQRHVDGAAALAEPNRLEVVDVITAADPVKNLLFFRQPVGWEEHGDRLADGLVGRVSEQSFGAGIPRQDFTLQALAEDGILR